MENYHRTDHTTEHLGSNHHPSPRLCVLISVVNIDARVITRPPGRHPSPSHTHARTHTHAHTLLRSGWSSCAQSYSVSTVTIKYFVCQLDSLVGLDMSFEKPDIDNTSAITSPSCGVIFHQVKRKSRMFTLPPYLGFIFHYSHPSIYNRPLAFPNVYLQHSEEILDQTG